MSNLINSTLETHQDNWKSQLSQIQKRLDQVEPVVVEGRLNRMVGLTLEAVGCQAVMGSRCLKQKWWVSPEKNFS